MLGIKSTGTKLLIYWKLAKKLFISYIQFFSCLNDSGKMWKLMNSVTSSKEKKLMPSKEII